MNYLAHIYLAGASPLAQVGGFSADGVKGNDYRHYTPTMRDAIYKHRLIDTFTDTHPLVREIRQEIAPLFGRYANVLIDIYFDYLLASDFARYTNGKSLRCYSLRFYFWLTVYAYRLPPRFKRFFLHFIFSDRLYKYRLTEGIKESLEIMAAYRGVAIEPQKATDYLMENEPELRRRFDIFFKELTEKFLQGL